MSGLIKAEPIGSRLRRVRGKGGGLAFYSPLRLYNNSIIAEKRKGVHDEHGLTGRPDFM